MPIFVAILFVMLSLMPAMVSAQDSSSAYRAVVEDIYRRNHHDSTRLFGFTAAIDTCTSNASAEALSEAFVDIILQKDSCNKNLALAYMYAGFFASNNGKVSKGLDLSFKGLEIADSLDMPRIKSNLLLNISTYLSGINDYDGAFKYIQKAQEVSEQAEDYENLVDIYYNIAISYIEQELFESAIKYFEKDIEASHKIGRTNTMEQQLTIQSLHIKNSLKIHDTTSALEQLDYVNGLIDRTPEIQDASGITNYCIAMLTSNMDAVGLNPKRRTEYLDYCRQYFEILRNAIDTAGIKYLEKVAYNPFYARYLAICGKLKQSWAILKDTSNFMGDDGRMIAMYDYYKAKKDYKNAYKYFWMLYVDKFKSHSLETAIHYEKSESRNRYEHRIAELQDMAITRQQEFLDEQQFNEIVRIGSIVVLLIGLAVIIVCLRYLRLRSRMNAELQHSNEELMLANEELNMQREEILTQTNEIQKQSEIIKAQRDDLSTTNHQLMASISTAFDIQSALMVSSEKLKEVVGENFIYWQPLNVVSGDFYWCTKIG
ncbi:MAG: hypothetical protein K6F33_08140, partial [Bacteroidales bacterium]|nr:hypothetical protein [Bacteroidales bacterium]